MLAQADTQILLKQQWITEKAFARIYGLSRQTLANWRYRDRLAGRREAASGYPQYRRWGNSIRYFIGDDGPIPAGTMGGRAGSRNQNALRESAEM
jgi:hypothetical protein